MRPTTVEIDHAALRHNLQQVARHAPQAQRWPAVKANAYGHGLIDVAHTLMAAGATGLAVACAEEALALRQAGVTQRLLLLEGPFAVDDLELAHREQLDLAIATPEQVARVVRTAMTPPGSPGLWLKLDSGMHRLGLSPAEFRAAYGQLTALPWVKGVHAMTHFACADTPEHPLNDHQQAVFRTATAGLAVPVSRANSAAILNGWAGDDDAVRPGIMMYGASPFPADTGADWQLRPVMTFKTALIAVKTVAAGETVGYGATFRCPETLAIGIAAVGYGDGYPRHAPSGTPVLVNGQRAALAGRVSMDMIAIDLRGVAAQVGDPVVLWGAGLPIEEIARAAQTIPYTLTCGITPRVRRQHLHPQV